MLFLVTELTKLPMTSCPMMKVSAKFSMMIIVALKKVFVFSSIVIFNVVAPYISCTSPVQLSTDMFVVLESGNVCPSSSLNASKHFFDMAVLLHPLSNNAETLMNGLSRISLCCVVVTGSILIGKYLS